MQNKVISNLIWRFLERCGAQFVTFVVSIVLARMLSPVEYGQVAIITVIITVLNVFVDCGFANALIQKQVTDTLDFSTVFYFNIISCTFLYIVVYLCSPLVGLFYNDLELISLLRVLALTIIVSGVKNVQQAYISRNFLFKKFFLSTLGGTMASAVIGIVMALNGFGVWSLVAQNLSNIFIDTSILWLTVGWKPTKEFSFERLNEMFSFGYKLLLSTVLNTLYSNFRQLIIGKVYLSTDLAFYNRGKQIPSLLMTNINTSIDSVLFPAMSEKQDRPDALKNMIQKSLCVSSFILWPLLFGMCAIAEPFISIVLTDKWLPCVPYLQIFCFVYATFPFQTSNLNAIKAIGRSDLYFKLEIEQTIIGIICLLSVCWISPLWIAIMYLVSSLINCVVICHESNKIFKYSLLNQLSDVLDNILLSMIMLSLTYLVYRIFCHNYAIVLQVVLGTVFYVLGAVVTKNKNMKMFFEIVKRKSNG